MTVYLLFSAMALVAHLGLLALGIDSSWAAIGLASVLLFAAVVFVGPRLTRRVPPYGTGIRRTQHVVLTITYLVAIGIGSLALVVGGQQASRSITGARSFPPSCLEEHGLRLTVSQLRHSRPLQPIRLANALDRYVDAIALRQGLSYAIPDASEAVVLREQLVKQPVDDQVASLLTLAALYRRLGEYKSAQATLDSVTPLIAADRSHFLGSEASMQTLRERIVLSKATADKDGLTSALRAWCDEQGSVLRVRERELLVYSSLNAEVNRALENSFRKTRGIPVRIVTFEGAAWELVNFVSSKCPDAKPDVFLGGTVELYDQHQRDWGDLRSIPARIGSEIPEDFRSPFWRPWYRGYLAIVYRPDVPSAARIRAAKSWEVLSELDKSTCIMIPDPQSVGAGRVFLATQFERLGSRATQFLQEVKRRSLIGETSVSAIHAVGRARPEKHVGQERCDVGVAWLHDALRLKRDAEYDYEILLPDVTGVEVGGVAILNSTKVPEEAEAFVEHLLDSSSQEANCRFGYREALTRGGISCELQDLARPRVKALPADRRQWARMMDKWVREWDDLQLRH